MKKPSLRFRQVFEHPTHFKVTRPLGNPIKIAKQGLSPGLMGRLRKFAQAGEVTDPVETTGDERAIDFEQPATAPTIPFDGAPRERSLEEIDQSLAYLKALEMTQSADDVAQLEKIKASDVQQAPVVIPAAPPMDVTTVPRVRISTPDEMMGSPAPTTTTPKTQAEPESVPDLEIPAPAVKAESDLEIPVPAVVKPEAAAPAAEKTKPVPAEPSLFERALKMVNFDLAKYEAASPKMKPIIRQAAQAAFAAKAVADADVAAAEAETSALADEQKAQKEELARLQESAKRSRDIQEKILSEYDYLKDPASYLGSMSTLGQIGTAISLAAGAFASGMTGMPNFAQKIYDNAIEQDLQAQKRRSDSLYQRLVNAGSSVENAENMVRAQLKLVGAAEQTRRAAEIKLPQVKAKIEATAAKSALDAANTMERIARDQAKEARESALAPLRERKLKAETVIAEGTPARLKEEMRLRREKADLDREQAEQARQDRIAATKDKEEQKRIARGLTVGTTELELKSETGSKDVRDNIAAREQAMMSILKLESLFKKEGLGIYKPFSDARTEAIEELSTFIEQYPKAAGFKRAISLSAAKQLKEGLQNPAGGFAFVKKILGADPTVAITGIRKEVQRSYADQIRSVVRNPQSDVVNDAILSAYAKADQEIKKYEMMQTADEEL
ncbi:MAG: hypothetical protein KGN78_04830 [Actinomycetales bacterium]|nr:hypothetical protein [Actinomycetales bacterium]